MLYYWKSVIILSINMKSLILAIGQCLEIQKFKLKIKTERCLRRKAKKRTPITCILRAVGSM